MINLEEEFSPRVNPADANYPFGSIKDNTSPGANDGTPLAAVWGNDWQGFAQAAMTEAGITPSGLPDTAQDSQMLEAVKAVTSGSLRDELLSGDGSSIQIERPADSTTEKFPKTLNFYFKSAPINLSEALPGNYVTDGSVDYSAYVQKVCEYLKEFGGGKIIVPHNCTILVDNILSYANIEWFGNDWTSTILVKPDNYYGISVNRYGMGTSNPDDNARNCVFRGFHLAGKVATAGFSEQKHLLNLNAVTHCLIEDMKFSGAQGDHVYVGSGNLAATERHNQFVTINRILIDGINKDNRNGVSVVDCDGFEMSNSEVRNCSRIDMPGAVDIEPNNNAFHIVKNIDVNNIRVKDCNMGGAAVGAYIPPLPAANNPVSIRFNQINVSGCPNAIGAQIVVRADTPRQNSGNGYSIKNVTAVGAKTPFWIEGAVNGVVEDCNFSACSGPAQVATIYNSVRNLDINRVSMQRVGTAGPSGLLIGSPSGLTVRKCSFSDCGGSAGSDIHFQAGSSDNVKIIDNSFDNPNLLNARIVTANAGHTFASASNEFRGNSLLGTKSVLAFPAYKSEMLGTVQNLFTPSTMPTAFPVGISKTLWNSPSDGTMPTGYTQGIVETIVDGSSIGANPTIHQKFLPRGLGTQLDTFYRYASADLASWGTWKKIVAVTA